MTPYYAWSIMPTIVSLTYWDRKSHFQHAEDSYNAGWVLSAVESGSFRFEVGGRSGYATRGDIVICPPGVVFHRKIVDPLSFFWIVLRWRSQSDMTIITDKDAFDGVVPTGKITIQDVQRLVSNFAYLRESLDITTAEAKQKQNFLMHDIWQMYCYENDKMLAEIAKTSDPLMDAAASLIKAEGLRPLSIQDLAVRLELSPVQLSRRFKANFGISPSDYLTDLRIQHAKILLAETKLTLEQIAERCGYESGFYLSRVFTKKMQMSPKQYRNIHFI
ncbi:MAG: AraC family transcriptional regulator [Paenibacillus sp.]|nr:AraC family transcriptional regulator [Paenibacillus sp.]